MPLPCCGAAHCICHATGHLSLLVQSIRRGGVCSRSFLGYAQGTKHSTYTYLVIRRLLWLSSVGSHSSLGHSLVIRLTTFHGATRTYLVCELLVHSAHVWYSEDYSAMSATEYGLLCKGNTWYGLHLMPMYGVVRTPCLNLPW